MLKQTDTAQRQPKLPRARRTVITETPRSLLPAGIAVYSIEVDAILTRERYTHTSPPESIAALAQSIHKYGIIHPLTVKSTGDGKYRLVSGERRMQAVKLLGLSRVPCIVITTDEAGCSAISLCENFHTSNMHYLDIAESIAEVCEQFGYTPEEASERLCLSLRYTHEKLRLLGFSESERARIRDSAIEESTLYTLLALDDVDVRSYILRGLLTGAITQTRADKLVRCCLRGRGNSTLEHSSTYLIRDVRIFYNSVQRAIDVMRRAGHDITAEKREDDECTILTLKIPRL